MPSGPTKSANVSPTLVVLIISRVVFPSVWTTIVMVPLLPVEVGDRERDALADPSWRRSMTKWPGWAAAATSGASTSQRKVVSENAS